MLIHLHSQATMTPKVRAEIQASTVPAWVLAGAEDVNSDTELVEAGKASRSAQPLLPREMLPAISDVQAQHALIGAVHSGRQHPAWPPSRGCVRE